MRDPARRASAVSFLGVHGEELVLEFDLTMGPVDGLSEIEGDSMHLQCH